MQIQKLKIMFSGRKFQKLFNFLKIIFFCFPLLCFAQKISPFEHIRKNGFDTSNRSDNGKNFIYKVHKTVPKNNIHRLEESIKSFKKDIKLFEICNFIRSGVKANLHEKGQTQIDIAVTNYGYDGEIINCVLKYMAKDKVGTQIIFSEVSNGDMYFLIFTD